MEINFPLLQGHQMPLLVNEDGLEVAPQATVITMPGGYAAVPSDQITYGVRKVIAQPTLFQINPLVEQVEAILPLSHKGGSGRIVYAQPEEWGSALTDVLLGQLLVEVHDLDTDDLLLFAFIMNDLLRGGAEGFRFGPELIRRVTRKVGQRRTNGGCGVIPPQTPWPPEYLIILHQRLNRLARLTVYAPNGNVFISGRYYKGVPFQGGSIINVGNPISFLTTLTNTRIPAEWLIQPGPVGLFLIREFGVQGDRAQFCPYPMGLFCLNLHHRDGAFRLGLHICQLWRIRSGQRKQGEMAKTWVPLTLFDAAGITFPSDRRLYDRWLQNRSDDLEALVELGLLNSWEWAPRWAADLAQPGTYGRRNRGWFHQLMNDGRLVLEPGLQILRQLADSGLPEAQRYLKQLTRRAGVGSPQRALPGPIRQARRRSTISKSSVKSSARKKG